MHREYVCMTGCSYGSCWLCCMRCTKIPVYYILVCSATIELCVMHALLIMTLAIIKSWHSTCTSTMCLYHLQFAPTSNYRGER